MTKLCMNSISGEKAHTPLTMALLTTLDRPFQDAIRAGAGNIMCSYNRINDSYGCELPVVSNILLILFMCRVSRKAYPELWLDVSNTPIRYLPGAC